MKKTREALIDTIEKLRFNNYQGHVCKFDGIEYLVNLLIKEGWVKLDEPREYWILKDSVAETFYDNLSDAEKASKWFKSDVEIIHVREVLDD